MIFRYLYNRYAFQAFGRFLDKSQLENLVSETTEWQALKFFLPRRWFYTREQEKDGLLKLIRMANAALSEARAKEKIRSDTIS
jgi:hypothetical protein